MHGEEKGDRGNSLGLKERVRLTHDYDAEQQLLERWLKADRGTWNMFTTKKILCLSIHWHGFELFVREIEESSGDWCGKLVPAWTMSVFLALRDSNLDSNLAIVKDFCQTWEKIKFDFDNAQGDVHVELPLQIATMWEKQPATSGMRGALITSWSFDELGILDDDMRSIFNPVVDRILELMEERTVSDLNWPCVASLVATCVNTWILSFVLQNLESVQCFGNAYFVCSSRLRLKCWRARDSFCFYGCTVQFLQED